MDIASQLGNTDDFHVRTPNAVDTGTFQAGDLIAHNIRLVELLGVGGMGNVWLADHTGLETRVAVKFMSHELAQDPMLVARFAREARLVARIRSPHVVQIFDFATTRDGVPFIVMEWLYGEDLELRLRRRELTVKETSRILGQVCKALSKAHTLGIVHRDIKPDNVFLMDDDGDIFAKVVDFGIAKDRETGPEITVSGTTMGTPSYMSPEQLFRPKEVDFRSDLWSVAVMAYRCLTGRLPFEGESFGAICVAIDAGEFTPPTALNPQLPSGIDGWFKKALARRPEERFQSIAQMSHEYLAVLEAPKEPAHFSDGRISHRPRPRAQPFRLAVSLIGVALVAFAVTQVPHREVRDWAAQWLPPEWLDVAFPTELPAEVPTRPIPTDPSMLLLPRTSWSEAFAEREKELPVVEPKKHDPAPRDLAPLELAPRLPAPPAESAPAPVGTAQQYAVPPSSVDTSPFGI